MLHTTRYGGNIGVVFCRITNVGLIELLWEIMVYLSTCRLSGETDVISPGDFRKKSCMEKLKQYFYICRFWLRKIGEICFIPCKY